MSRGSWRRSLVNGRGSEGHSTHHDIFAKQNA